MALVRGRLREEGSSVDSVLVTFLIAFLFAPAAAPVVALTAKRTKRRTTLMACLCLATLASLFAYGLWGMHYEDRDLPYPLWWQLGVNAAWLESGLFFVLLLRSLMRPSDRAAEASQHEQP
jgi:predicted PurR-regulated permease PerM